MAFAARVTPARSYEELEIRTEDGAILRALVEEPIAGEETLGTCVLAGGVALGRAASGDPRVSSLARACANLGYRVIAFDFRGRGESKSPPGSVGAGGDDLVRHDLPAVVDCARARAEGRPTFVIGIRRAATVALAACGTGSLQADGLVVAPSPLRTSAPEPSRARRATGQVAEAALRAWVRRPGVLSTGAWFGRRRGWRSEDGRDDYLGALTNVHVPVYFLANALGWLSTTALAKRCRGPVEVRLARTDEREVAGALTWLAKQAQARP